MTEWGVSHRSRTAEDELAHGPPVKPSMIGGTSQSQSRVMVLKPAPPPGVRAGGGATGGKHKLSKQAQSLLGLDDSNNNKYNDDVSSAAGSMDMSREEDYTAHTSPQLMHAHMYAESGSTTAETATVASTSAWSQSNLGSTAAQQAGFLGTTRKSGLRFGASPPAVPSSGYYHYNPADANVNVNTDVDSNANVNVHSVSGTAKLTQHVREQQKALEDRRKKNKLKGMSRMASMARSIGGASLRDEKSESIHEHTLKKSLHKSRVKGKKKQKMRLTRTAYDIDPPYLRFASSSRSLSSTSSNGTTTTAKDWETQGLPMEMQIWRGIETLLGDAFDNSMHNNNHESSLEPHDFLPEKLLQAMDMYNSDSSLISLGPDPLSRAVATDTLADTLHHVSHGESKHTAYDHDDASFEEDPPSLVDFHNHDPDISDSESSTANNSISEEELEEIAMAQAALASFSRLLVPQKSNEEKYRDDDSLSDIASKLQRSLRGFAQRSATNLSSIRQLHNSNGRRLSASSFATSSLPDLQEIKSDDHDDCDYSATDEYNDLDSVVDMAELALTGFMETLLEGLTKNLTLEELQLSHHSNHSDEREALELQTKQKEALLEARLKKSSIALFDLFAWSLRVNIDADVKIQRSQEFIHHKDHANKTVKKSPTSSLSRKKNKKKPPKKSLALEQRQQQLPAIHDDDEEDAHTMQSEETDHPSLASHEQSKESEQDNDEHGHDGDDNSGMPSLSTYKSKSLRSTPGDNWASNSTGLPSLTPFQDSKEEMGGSVQFRDGSVHYYDDERKRYDMDDSQKSDDPSGPSGEMSLYSHSDSDSDSASGSSYSTGHTTISGDDNDDDDNSENYLRRSYNTAMSTSWSNISGTSSSSSYHTGSNGASSYSTGSTGVSSFAGIPNGTSESPSQMIDYSVSGSSATNNSSEPSNNNESVSNHSESTASSKPFYYTGEGKNKDKRGGQSVVTFTKNTVMGQKSTRSLYSRTQSISSMPSLETMNVGKRAEESSVGTDSDSRISVSLEELGHDSSSTNETRQPKAHESMPSLGPMEASTDISKGSADSNHNISKETSARSLSLNDLVYLNPIPQVAGAALQTGPRGVVTETLPGGLVMESSTPGWARDMQLHVSIRDHNFDESIQLKNSNESADKTSPPAVDPRNASLSRAISCYTKGSDEYNPFAGEDKQEGTPAVLRNLPAAKKDINEETAISEPTSALDVSGTDSKSAGAQSSTALPSSFAGLSKFSLNDSQSNTMHSFGDMTEFPDNYGKSMSELKVQVLNRKGDGLHIMPMGDKEKMIFKGDASFDSASFKSQRRPSSETGSLRSEKSKAKPTFRRLSVDHASDHATKKLSSRSSKPITNNEQNLADQDTKANVSITPSGPSNSERSDEDHLRNELHSSFRHRLRANKDFQKIRKKHSSRNIRSRPNIDDPKLDSAAPNEGEFEDIYYVARISDDESEATGKSVADGEDAKDKADGTSKSKKKRPGMKKKHSYIIRKASSRKIIQDDSNENPNKGEEEENFFVQTVEGGEDFEMFDASFPKDLINHFSSPDVTSIAVQEIDAPSASDDFPLGSFLDLSSEESAARSSRNAGMDDITLDTAINSQRVAPGPPSYRKSSKKPTSEKMKTATWGIMFVKRKKSPAPVANSRSGSRTRSRKPKGAYDRSSVHSMISERKSQVVDASGFVV